MRKIIIPLIIVLALVIGAGMWWFGAQKTTNVGKQNSIGSPAAFGERVPDLSLKDYDDKDVRFVDFSGKPLVINSWAMWCPFCVKELSDFATIQKEFGGRVVIIAVDRAESRDVAKDFTDKLGISNDLIFLLDANDSFYRAIGGFSMPETIFVKADGSIHFHKRGPMTVEEIRQRTQELVQ